MTIISIFVLGKSLLHMSLKERANWKPFNSESLSLFLLLDLFGEDMEESHQIAITKKIVKSPFPSCSSLLFLKVSFAPPFTDLLFSFFPLFVFFFLFSFLWIPPPHFKHSCFKECFKHPCGCVGTQCPHYIFLILFFLFHLFFFCDFFIYIFISFNVFLPFFVFFSKL